MHVLGVADYNILADFHLLKEFIEWCHFRQGGRIIVSKK